MTRLRTSLVGRASWRCHRLLCAIVCVVSGLAGPGCEMPEPGGGQGPGHRAQQLALTPEQEHALGRRAYAEVLREFQGRILPGNRPEVRRVHQVTARIVRAATIEPLLQEINLHVRGFRFDWEVNVIESNQINAFALPGGKIVVFTGILHVADDNDQLAAVLAHEIAHVLAHHASERLARAQAGGGGFFQRKAYDREQESEADHIGVFLMTFAGYQPEEAIRFWQKMLRMRGDQGLLPALLSDHPSDAQRIRDLEKWVPQARAAKRAYDERRIAPERVGRMRNLLIPASPSFSVLDQGRISHEHG